MQFFHGCEDVKLYESLKKTLSDLEDEESRVKFRISNEIIDADAGLDRLNEIKEESGPLRRLLNDIDNGVKYER